MPIISCTFAEHGATVRAIFNDAIVNSTALYDYQPRSPAAIDAWFQAKSAAGHPILGWVDAAAPEQLLGFATYGEFRARPANKYTVEHSIYVHKDHRGRGLGRALLEALIARATQQQLHVMVGAIDAANPGSIVLHEKLGFTHAGTLRQIGFKFGRWLDLALYQRILATPAQPVDG